MKQIKIKADKKTKHIGIIIKKYRKYNGFSQLEVEIAIGSGHGSISRIETGEVNPTKETLAKLINELKINQEDMMVLLGIGK